MDKLHKKIFKKVKDVHVQSLIKLFCLNYYFWVKNILRQYILIKYDAQVKLLYCCNYDEATRFFCFVFSEYNF